MKGEVRQVNGLRVATPEYRSWQMMKNRCLNSKATDYASYGGRGILMDARWMEFEAFLADMGRRPSPKHTLDRINNEDHYYAANCRWATRREQSQNRGAYNKCSMEIAETIRTMYATGDWLQHELGDHFGLTQAHISQIIRNVVWPRETESAR